MNSFSDNGLGNPRDIDGDAKDGCIVTDTPSSGPLYVRISLQVGLAIIEENRLHHYLEVPTSPAGIEYSPWGSQYFWWVFSGINFIEKGASAGPWATSGGGLERWILQSLTRGKRLHIWDRNYRSSGGRGHDMWPWQAHSYADRDLLHTDVHECTSLLSFISIEQQKC